jgi:hypothetical protein
MCSNLGVLLIILGAGLAACALDRNRAADGAASGGEGDDEAVAHALDLVAAMVGYLLPDEFLVFFQDSPSSLIATRGVQSRGPLFLPYRCPRTVSNRTP